MKDSILMKRPVRLWLPTVGRSIFDPAHYRDLIRLQSLWDGELVLYCLPELNEKKITWQADKRSERLIGAIGAEQLNVFNVVNIDRLGNMNPVCLPGIDLVPRYSDWLNAKYEIEPEFCQINIEAPFVKNGSLVFDNDGNAERSMQRTEVLRGALFPTDHFKRESKRLSVDRHAEFFSRNDFVQEVQMIDGKQQRQVRNSRGEVVFEQFKVRWPEPFETLFVLGNNHELIDFHSEVFPNIIRNASNGNLDKALSTAAMWHHRHSFQTNTTWGESFASPKLKNHVGRIIDHAIEKTGKGIDDFKRVMELEEQPDLWEANAGSVVNCVGWVGLFFYQLYSDLMATRGIGICANVDCGRVFESDSIHQSYCKTKVCADFRAAIRQKKQRQKRSKNGKEMV